MCAVAYWSRRAARLHSSIRGLSPQAGGFRRRSNRPSSVSRVTGLAHDPYERLPCVQQVLTRHLLFRIILQYAAVFQPRVLFLFRGTRNILPTDPSVYALLYIPNFCSRQNLASLAQNPVALQRRLRLLRQCLCDVSLLHQRIQVRRRKPGLTRDPQLRRYLAPAPLARREQRQQPFRRLAIYPLG